MEVGVLGEKDGLVLVGTLLALVLKLGRKFPKLELEKREVSGCSSVPSGVIKDLNLLCEGF